MDKGKIVQMGTPTELLYKPANRFVESFLKEQRLQLEFKVVRVKDIWGLLPRTEKAGDTDLNADITVWSGMENFKSLQADHLNITHENETRSVAFEQLVTAFYKYQNGRPHE
jgi:osmoprotectant transport system ATP-binding protein